MPVTVTWLDSEQTVAVWTMTEPWTWEDTWQALDETNAIQAAHGRRTDNIIDMRQAGSLPQGNVLGVMRRGYNQGGSVLTLVVGASAFIHGLLNAFSGIYRTAAMRTADSIEEAQAIIAADRLENG